MSSGVSGVGVPRLWRWVGCCELKVGIWQSGLCSGWGGAEGKRKHADITRALLPSKNLAEGDENQQKKRPCSRLASEAALESTGFGGEG